MTDSLDMNCWCCKKEISKLSALGCGYCDDCYKFKTSETSEWISVKERLPELKVSDEEIAEWPSDNVLVCDSKKDMYVAYFSSYGWNEVGTGCGCCCSGLDVTHWMPLPEPPN